MSMKKTKVTINRWLLRAAALLLTSSTVAVIIAIRVGMAIDIMKIAFILLFFFFFLLFMLKDDASVSLGRFFMSLAVTFTITYAFVLAIDMVGLECRITNVFRFTAILSAVMSLFFSWTWFKEEGLS